MKTSIGLYFLGRTQLPVQESPHTEELSYRKIQKNLNLTNAVCVYDLYEDSLTAYREAVTKVTDALKSMEVPEADWPRNLRTSERNKDVTLTVFEQMELERDLAAEARQVGYQFWLGSLNTFITGQDLNYLHK
ncbi:hypothetical protein DFJ43DRAFT_1036597 [Lentinula guzmanii]|uniref:Uncharacterized protein n=1 Tax=Lentinula guzmanii TaxID=2804957 RepID=A0AA38JP40_9AGAR|nr:hypothetical protein DFJ43DRAFT_1036597 [Lentinula guzmanii]